MTYRLFSVQLVIRYPEAPQAGPEPDGDTVKFLPDDPAGVADLARAGGVEPGFSSLHRISLRLEGIDALETHFAGTHQELGLARAARDHLLAALGFRDVVFDPQRPDQVRSANADRLPGWVLSNGLDAHGRLVAFLFCGPAPRPEGAEVFLTAEQMAASVNVDLLRIGLVYPMLYTSLPVDLREPLAAVAAAARAAGLGLWPRSTADPGSAADLSGPAGPLPALRELVIWPKLFRRLVSFLAAGNGDLSGFEGWLQDNPAARDDPLVLLPSGEPARLHQVLTVGTDGTLALTRWPETIVVLPATWIQGQGSTAAASSSYRSISATLAADGDAGSNR